MKNLTALIALLAVFTLAICFILIGSISEEIKVALHINNSQVGSLASALFLTSLAVQLFIGVMVDKLGHRVLAIAGFFVTSGAIFLLAFAGSFSMAMAACALLGVGAMCVNTVGNTLIPIVLFGGKDPARASNFGNGFVGLAFVLTPLVLGYLMQNAHVSYSAALSSIAVVVFLFGLLALAPRYPEVSPSRNMSRVSMAASSASFSPWDCWGRPWSRSSLAISVLAPVCSAAWYSRVSWRHCCWFCLCSCNANAKSPHENRNQRRTRRRAIHGARP